MLGTPYERPAELAGRTVLNDEEFAAREAADRDRPTRFGGVHRPAGREPAASLTLGRTRQAVATGLAGRRARRWTTPANDARGRRAHRASPEARTLRFSRRRRRAPVRQLRGSSGRTIAASRAAARLGAAHRLQHGNQILQIPGYVVIRNEMIHETRIIPLDGRAHVGSNIRSTWATRAATGKATRSSSRPRTSTAGRARRERQHGADQPSLRMVERLTRVDADTIHYEATVDDPQTWTRPWKWRFR